MKIIVWFKSLSWIVIAGAATGAIYMIFNAVRASQLEDRAKAAEQREADRINEGTTAALKKAAKLQAGVVRDKKSAANHAKKAKAHWEKLGEDRTMADIADSFNKRRVRGSTGSIT